MYLLNTDLALMFECLCRNKSLNLNFSPYHLRSWCFAWVWSRSFQELHIWNQESQLVFCKTDYLYQGQNSYTLLKFSFLEEGSFLCGLCPISKFISVWHIFLFSFDRTFCKMLNSVVGLSSCGHFTFTHRKVLPWRGRCTSCLMAAITL